MLSHVSFTSVPVDDFDRAKAFYSGPLGLAVVTDAPYGRSGGSCWRSPGRARGCISGGGPTAGRRRTRCCR